MNEYDIFIRHSFFNHHYHIKANSITNALDMIRNNYNVSNFSDRKFYIITSLFENGKKIISEQKLFM